MKILNKSVEYSLFLFFGTVLFQAILFLMNGSVSVMTLVLATAAWLIYSYFVTDDKKIIKENFIVIAVVWSIMLLMNSYFTMFHETTYDGSYYHGNAMVEMLNGWNPFYEADNYQNTGVTIWSDYYPKATWMFGAILIKLFNHLSSAMMINTMITFTTVAYAFAFFRKRNMGKLMSFVMTLVLLMNPITLEQTHTYYVDGLIGNFVALLLIFGIEIMEEYSLHKNVLIYIISVLLINIKFSSFGFAGLVNVFIWIYFLLKDRKHVLHYTLFGVAMIVTGVMIVGFSPYMINVLKLRHIFYPIAGKDAQDVVTYLIPNELYGKNPLYKLVYSIFCGPSIKENLLNFEVQGYLLYDERVGAFGNMFGKIVVLSALVYGVWGIWAIRTKKFHLPYLLAFLGLSASVLANYQNIWWFRYAPQIWLYVMIAMWMLSKGKGKALNLIFVALILYQGGNIFYHTQTTDYAKSRSIEIFYEEYAGKELTAQIKTNDLQEIYWFDAYEAARCMQEGIEVTLVHDRPINDPDACHYMHPYRICPVE